MRIAVYGTLRQGFGNNRYLLSDQEYLGQQRVDIPYRMVSLGGFPGLIPDKENHSVVVEVYDVDQEAARNVDSLEGWPHWYKRVEIETNHGLAWIYYLDGSEYQTHNPVLDGDWANYVRR